VVFCFDYQGFAIKLFVAVIFSVLDAAFAKLRASALKVDKA
jgi:hypothetical protein